MGLSDLRNVKGNIFNIQRYSVHDGPGIRSTVFFKGCPLRCFWCQNPESQTVKTELFWNKSLCTGCGRCISACPRCGISVKDGRIVQDWDACIKCGSCVAACPNKARSTRGYSITAGEVVDELLRDRRMYTQSGGGITLSGGEVTMQPDFAVSILKLCKGNWLHTAIETCGYKSWDKLEKILEYTDFVMYDIKCVDDARHKEGTGVSNRLILENAAKIAAMKPVLFRMPLIPGYNDSDEDVKEFSALVKGTFGLSAENMELLKYNTMGEEKYSHMGCPEDDVPRYQSQSEERFAYLKSLL